MSELAVKNKILKIRVIRVQKINTRESQKLNIKI